MKQLKKFDKRIKFFDKRFLVSSSALFISAWLLLKKRKLLFARRSMNVSVIFGLGIMLISVPLSFSIGYYCYFL